MPPPPSTTLVSAVAEFQIAAAPPARTWNTGFARSAKFWRALVASAGPGYLIAVGYMDPGNWATDIAGGSNFGFALLPVIVFSNFAAMFLQRLALRLGIVTGQDLAQLCRARYSPWVSRLLWLTCEIAIIACDLAEVIGTAIALKLLFHIPLVWGVALTAFDTLLIMTLQKSGMRALEAIVIALIGVIGACFLYEMMVCRPSGAALAGSFVPDLQLFAHPLALYIALGIFGATVMPHNLYLHSALARRHHPGRAAPKATGERIRFATFDCFGALAIAVLINAAILITAASAFHSSGHSGVGTIEEAYRLLAPALGAGGASLVFAVALLAAGQNSTLTGTMAGQIAMEGFLGLKLSPCVTRMLTRGLAILPALAVTALAGENASTQLLIASQVILSLQLGFAVVPLVTFTSDRKLMGRFANGRWTRRGGYALACAIIGVNSWLVVQTIT
jgi:manganese transport protein